MVPFQRRNVSFRGVCFFFLWYKVTGTRADRYKRSDMGLPRINGLKSMGLPGLESFIYIGVTTPLITSYNR